MACWFFGAIEFLDFGRYERSLLGFMSLKNIGGGVFTCVYGP